MTEEYRQRMYAEAVASRDSARSAMNAARRGSKAWRDAADDLDWWIGRVASLMVPAR